MPEKLILMRAWGPGQIILLHTHPHSQLALEVAGYIISAIFPKCGRACLCRGFCPRALQKLKLPLEWPWMFQCDISLLWVVWLTEVCLGQQKQHDMEKEVPLPIPFIRGYPERTGLWTLFSPCLFSVDSFLHCNNWRDGVLTVFMMVYNKTVHKLGNISDSVLLVFPRELSNSVISLDIIYFLSYSQAPGSGNWRKSSWTEGMLTFLSIAPDTLLILWNIFEAPRGSKDTSVKFP